VVALTFLSISAQRYECLVTTVSKTNCGLLIAVVTQTMHVCSGKKWLRMAYDSVVSSEDKEEYPVWYVPLDDDNPVSFHQSLPLLSLVSSHSLPSQTFSTRVPV